MLKDAYSSIFFRVLFQSKQYFYFYNSGQDEHHLYIKKGDANKVILDPNTWSNDQTLNLDDTSLSPDEKYLAYSVTDGGVDWRTIKILDMESGLNLDHEVTEVKFSDIAWNQIPQVFYNKYQTEASVRLSQQSYDAAIYFFNIETGQEKLLWEINSEENMISFIEDEEGVLIEVI